jgi:hypothetical protein
MPQIAKRECLAGLAATAPVFAPKPGGWKHFNIGRQVAGSPACGYLRITPAVRQLKETEQHVWRQRLGPEK